MFLCRRFSVASDDKIAKGCMETRCPTVTQEVMMVLSNAENRQKLREAHPLDFIETWLTKRCKSLQNG